MDHRSVDHGQMSQWIMAQMGHGPWVKCVMDHRSNGSVDPGANGSVIMHQMGHWS